MDNIKPEHISLYIQKLRKYLGVRLNDDEVYTLAKDIINRKEYDFPLHCLSEVMIDEGIATFPEKWVGDFGSLVYDDVMNKVYERYLYGDEMPNHKWYETNLHILLRHYEKFEEYEKCECIQQLLEEYSRKKFEDLTKIYSKIFDEK